MKSINKDKKVSKVEVAPSYGMYGHIINVVI